MSCLLFSENFYKKIGLWISKCNKRVRESIIFSLSILENSEHIENVPEEYNKHWYLPTFHFLTN